MAGGDEREDVLLRALNATRATSIATASRTEPSRTRADCTAVRSLNNGPSSDSWRHSVKICEVIYLPLRLFCASPDQHRWLAVGWS